MGPAAQDRPVQAECLRSVTMVTVLRGRIAAAREDVAVGKRFRRALYVAGVIERLDNHVLIALPQEESDTARRWQFPRGLAKPHESPEAAMRRVAEEKLGLFVEIVVGQPPLLCQLSGKEVEVRYFFCGVAAGGCRTGSYVEILWIPKAHLREYDFDDASQPVANWLLAQTP